MSIAPLRHTSIRRKLLTLSLAAGLAFLTVSALFFLSWRDLEKVSTRVSSTYIPTLSEGAGALVSVSALGTELFRYVNHIEPSAYRIADALEGARAALRRIAASDIPAEIRANIESLLPMIAAQEAGLSRLTERVDRDDVLGVGEEHTRMAAEAGLMLRGVERINGQLLASVAEENRDSAREAMRRATVVAAVSLLCILAALLYAFKVRRDLEAGLEGLREGARRYAAGESASIDPLDRKDEIGQLSSYLNGLSKQLADQRQRVEDQVKLTRDLIDGNPNPVYLKDEQCRFLEVNPAYSQLTRVTPEKAKGRTVFDLYQTERAAVFDRQDRELLARGEGSSVIEVDYQFPERQRHFLMSKTILKRADGSVRGLVGTLTDITEFKDLESRLRASREEALQAAQAKAAFLAAMSHEIRTPLNGVLGMAGLLEGTQLTPEQREYIETIQLSGDALLAVINDVLDYSKFESGRMELEQAPLQPVRAIEESLEILGARARAKGLELIAETDDGLPPWVLGDLARLRQVLVNLVGNAVKFTDAGRIVVTARAPAADVLEFTVRDTGIGIPQERIGALFRAFTQGDASTARKYGGTGLGLAISRRLVEFMGGELRVESEQGRGSTFIFSVRAQPCAPSAAPQAARFARPDEGDLAKRLPLRILIADDVEVNRRLTLALLRNFGYAADAVGTGREAIEAACSGGYDVVLMDVQMPDVDGLEATRLIRERTGDGGPRIVALTASAMAGDRERCIASGMDDYLAKPLQPQALRAALEQVGRSGARQAGRKRAARPAGAIDWSRIESLKPFDPDGSMVAGVVAVFLADAPERIRAIRAAHARSDTDDLVAAAHALKGAAANIGAARLQELSQSIESLALEDRAAEAGKAIEALEKSLAEAGAALAKGKSGLGAA